MKIFLRQAKRMFFISAMALLTFSCEKEYFPVVPPPPPPPPAKTPLETTTLEASYVTSPPITISNAYWKSADYLKVPVGVLNPNSLLYSDGFLNMTGTYNGLSSFNGGADPKVVMKAAYDNDKLYVYVEWLDTDISPALEAATLKGPTDPLKTSESTTGWTSQGNCDKLSLAFNIANASSSAGTFVDKGCAASCHNNKMQPQSGSVDFWTWDVAISDALGYASDLYSDASNVLMKDAGSGMAVSNKKAAGVARSEPAYEWDGAEQSYLRPDGKSVTLDAAYFLLNKTIFKGNSTKGDSIYHQPAEGVGCWHCHGINGLNGEATPFASPAFARKYSRTSMEAFSKTDEHPGKTYFASVSPSSYDDLFAFIRGIGRVPGYYLTPPSGSSADVWTVSNISRTRIDVTAAHTLYQVLLIRNLTTPNSDDVQFTNPQGTSLPFGIALMNADGKNHIGSIKQTLTFKSKTP